MKQKRNKARKITVELRHLTVLNAVKELVAENKRLKDEIKNLAANKKVFKDAIDKIYYAGGKPISRGEEALIKAIRNISICSVLPWNTPVVCFSHVGTETVSYSDHAITFLPPYMVDKDKAFAVIDALKMIQREKSEF